MLFKVDSLGLLLRLDIVSTRNDDHKYDISVIALDTEDVTIGCGDLFQKILETQLSLKVP
jgi:hypothetical protein